ncbi:MAG: rhomboid family intramembrane serine protease [Gammaproteobacteria bacterium]
MSSLVDQFNSFVQSVQDNLHYSLGFIAILFAVQIVNVILNYRLNIFGIYPRKVPGLIGIPASPFLHGSFSHLIFNSIPLFILSTFLLTRGFLDFLYITALIIVISGAAVWLFGRKALHVGASGLIMGYWGYLVVDGIMHPSLLTIFLIVICFYYFGGFVTSLLPTEEKTSWEGHIFGLLAGIAVNLYNLDAWLYSVIGNVLN